MKILKLGDLHFGVKKDDKWLQNIQRDGIRQAIEISKKHGITKWIQTGDWFDVRSAISHKCMEFNREIAEKIEEAGIEVDVIVGNHDMHFKNKITPNACIEVLSQFKNFRVYDKPTTVIYDDVEIDLIPWICEENQQEIMNFVEKTKSRYCVGHFELSGFYFYKGLKSHGDDPQFLRKYKKVWSGHFHTQSENRNVQYLGTPWSLTSGDENDPRGFWIFDTETEESEFVQNETMWHRRIEYPCSINPKTFENLSVRVFVTKMDNSFGKFETALESVVHEMKVVSKIDLSVGVETTDEIEEENVEIKPLIDLMMDYVSVMPNTNEQDVDSIQHMTKNLYLECTK